MVEQLLVVVDIRMVPTVMFLLMVVMVVVQRHQLMLQEVLLLQLLLQIMEIIHIKLVML